MSLLGADRKRKQLYLIGAFVAFTLGFVILAQTIYAVPAVYNPNAVLTIVTAPNSGNNSTLIADIDAGSGSVTPNCPSGCLETVGASVTVTASPSSGWQFSNWSTQTGISSCSASSCTFTMPSNAVTLKATFTQTSTTCTTTLTITTLPYPPVTPGTCVIYNPPPPPTLPSWWNWYAISVLWVMGSLFLVAYVKRF